MVEGKLATVKVHFSAITTNAPIYQQRGNKMKNYSTICFKEKICRACGIVATQRECPAIKMLEYNRVKGILEVTIMGNIHVSQKKTEKPVMPSFCNNYRSTQIWHQNNFRSIVSKKVDSADITGAQEVTKKLSDRSRIRQLRAEILEPSQNVEPHSFEAVAIFKQACDKVDQFYIFEISDERINNDSDFCFKTSKMTCELGLLMDQDNTVHNALMDENAYFNGAHNRSRDFISLALWLYHRSIRKLLKLACMECRKESTKTIAMFFKIWKNTLMVSSGKSTPYLFNPKKHHGR